MEQTPKDYLLAHHQQISDGMVDVPAVCRHLISSRALTQQMVEGIMVNGAESIQAGALNTWMSKLPEHYDKYYKALCDSGNTGLAQILEERVAPRGEHVGGPSATGSAAASVTGHVFPRVTERAGEQESSIDDVDPLTLTVQVCDWQDPTVIKALQSTETYPMKSGSRGEVLIINIVNFAQPIAKREGSNVDAAGAEHVFNQLGFSGRIRVMEDLTASRIHAAVVNAADRARKTDSCFICVVLSHGTMGAVYGVDGDTITLLQLTKIVCGNECPNLIGKPKLFFIQACQGDHMDTGVVQPDSGGDDAQWKQLVSEMKATLGTTDGDKPTDPTMADLFVAVATYPGFVAFREPTGTWFIQALLRVFVKEAHRCHLIDMMTMVNDHVSKKMGLAANYKQVSKYESTLRKKMYFFPGLPEDQTPRQ